MVVPRQGVSARSDLAVLDPLVKARPKLARDIGNCRALAYKALTAAGVEVPCGSRMIA